MEKDTSVIPKGSYCYTYENDKIKICPYWKTIKDRPIQYNGWCDYLEAGDLELEKELTYTDVKTGEKTMGVDLPFPVSLLWDQCKMCHINDDIEEEDLDEN